MHALLEALRSLYNTGHSRKISAPVAISVIIIVATVVTLIAVADLPSIRYRLVSYVLHYDSRLIMAAEHHDLQKVERLLDEGANVNSQDNRGITPLVVPPGTATSVLRGYCWTEEPTSMQAVEISMRYQKQCTAGTPLW